MKFFKKIAKKKQISKKIEHLKKEYQEAFNDAAYHFANKNNLGYTAAHERMHKAHRQIMMLRECIA